MSNTLPAARANGEGDAVAFDAGVEVDVRDARRERQAHLRVES